MPRQEQPAEGRLAMATWAEWMVTIPVLELDRRRGLARDDAAKMEIGSAKDPRHHVAGRKKSAAPETPPDGLFTRRFSSIASQTGGHRQDAPAMAPAAA